MQTMQKSTDEKHEKLNAQKGAFSFYAAFVTFSKKKTINIMSVSNFSKKRALPVMLMSPPVSPH